MIKMPDNGRYDPNGIQLRHFKYKIIHILHTPSLRYTICSPLNAIFCLTECHWVRPTIPHTGTLGILAMLAKQCTITFLEGNTWLRQMIERGYHSPIQKSDELVTS